MTSAAERIEALRRRAAWEREDLSAILREMREEASSSRARWRLAR